MSSQRQGKIARLPATLRDMANSRILDGWTGRRICEWLNNLPEVQTVLADHFDSEAITEANLTRWRQGGYRDWLRDREQASKIRSLAEYCQVLTETEREGPAGQGIAAGASTILAAKMLEMIEGCEPETAMGFAKAIAGLRENEIAGGKLRLAEVKALQEERALSLAEQKFKRETAELFLKFYDDQKSKEIASSGSLDKEAKLKALASAWWGDAPDGIGPSKLETPES